MAHATHPITLTLGENAIRGHGVTVRVTLPIPDKDLSGSSSKTMIAERGFKKKRIAVRLYIRYEDEEHLARIYKLAEAIDDAGDRVIYPIVNITTRAANIKKARFSGEVSAREQDGEQTWAVTFSMVEVESVPELKEDRLDPAETATIATTGEEVIAEEEEPEAEEPDTRELTAIEKKLAAINQALASWKE
uniref:Uncharacterized protein n=1 Tax=Candidatus Kentrum sp. FM TaxID=2126340 RepID=A0A450RV46_9GAMM|nr:MAG: hypothetical protein BECKFM1743A_GA0114220_1000337 [Candidatus Kentron sp. FM]VFJ43726.1 MAG: hypothetical protein BECKFM1743C_GA0114222_1000337 [Candidatus Kentron sp. FM]VFK05704.1 MAG: hypothetical protein BECKFM1743B_GA0114221_1000337 [Candidatus Kentron sp. FM]